VDSACDVYQSIECGGVNKTLFAWFWEIACYSSDVCVSSY